MTATDLLVDFMTGFAQLLAAELDGYSYDATDAGDTTPIVWPTASDAPARVLILAAYELGDDSTQNNSTVGLQVRARTDSDDAGDAYRMLGACSEVLLGLYPYTLPTGVRLNSLISTSASTPIQVQRRWTGTKNFVWDVYNPTAHRQ